MSDTPAMPYDYQSEGGALLLDAPTYVKRQADDDLYAGLKAGQFCYVLNARQMGKSSLKVRTLQRLRDEGVACAAVDLQGIGTSATEEQWYFGIISRIARSLGLHRQVNLNTWWTEQPRLSYVQRFVEFLEALLLPAVAEPIVIFIDEVDLTLNLAFRDDFFGALRESYNRRADEPEYRRLTFALFGVTTPSDLIQNKQTTPFNIGRPVDLTGLHLEEAQPLIPGLVAKAHNPQALLQAVLDWTGGQPFLTQKLCRLVQSAESAPLEGQEHQWVEQLVQVKVIDNWEAQDIPPHLKTIRDRLLLSGEQRTGRLLGLYQQIVQQGELAADDSPEQVELRLTGLVVKRDGKLRVYNRIYEQVFNRAWLERSLAELRPYGGAIAAWLASEHQDESRLLRGQALQDARTWAEGKSLGDDDRRFLDASQELEKRDMQKKLAVEEEAKQVLTEAHRKANQRLRIGSFVLGTALLVAVGASVFAGRQSTVAKQSRSEAISAKQQVKTEKENLEIAKQNVKSAEDRKKEADQDLVNATRQEKSARQQYQKAQQQLEQVNQDKFKANRQAQAAKQLADAAGEKAQFAQAASEKAKRDLDQAEIQLAQTVSEIRVQKALNVEKSAKVLLSEFKALKSDQLDTLVSLLRLGQEWQSIVEERQSTQADTTSKSNPGQGLRESFRFVLENKLGGADNKSSPVIREKLKLNLVGDVHSIGFTPDGKYFLTSEYFSTSGRIRLWDTSGKQHQKFDVTASNATFSQRCLATVGDGRNIRLWNYRDGRLEATEIIDSSAVNGHNLAFSKDGRYSIASSNYAGTKGTNSVFSRDKNSLIRIWEILNCRKMAERQPIRLGTEDNFISELKFSSNGQKVLAIVAQQGEGLKNFRVKVWDMSGTLLRTLPDDWVKGKPQNLEIARFAKGLNGYISDIEPWFGDAFIITDLYQVHFIIDPYRDLNYALVSSVKHNHPESTGVYEGFGSKPITRIRLEHSNSDFYFATSGSDGIIRLWNSSGAFFLFKSLREQPQESSIDPRHFESRTSGSGLNPLTGELSGGANTGYNSMQFSPDGKWLASLNNAGVQLWKFEPAELDLDADLGGLMTQTCDWLKDYLASGLKLDEKDRQLCNSSHAIPSLLKVNELSKVGKIDEASAALQQLQKFDPSFQIAIGWNSLCWFGSLNGYSAKVLNACEKAVSLDPFEGWRDSRGLVRALTGNTAGAIDDFQTYVKQSGNSVRKAQRQRWIDELRAGKPPAAIFTKEVLEQLRNE